MPPIIPILLVLLIAIFVVLKITSARGSEVSEEQMATYSKWLRILVPAVLIAAAIRYFFF
ncbi:hypothetical protein [Saccharospirillum mangrovi]|uniref:hypothetical protein n=1 Tax=Saccharospirillum mangrovi TaxID=2161747 RepID=UPI000D37F414|nr:hypothetical protein [Saccharospirillum mangrovi]